MSIVGRPAENHPQQVGKRGALEKVDDRRTPREVFDPLNEEFGFTIDVAASTANALSDVFYTRQDNALGAWWGPGAVWCNPPYSDLRPWVEKAQEQIALDHGPAVIVMLLPANRCEQGWWQDLIEPGRRAGTIEVRFLRGRLRFDTPDYDYTAQPKGNRPPFGVVLVIWRRVSERVAAGGAAE